MLEEIFCGKSNEEISFSFGSDKKKFLTRPRPFRPTSTLERRDSRYPTTDESVLNQFALRLFNATLTNKNHMEDIDIHDSFIHMPTTLLLANSLKNLFGNIFYDLFLHEI